VENLRGWLTIVVGRVCLDMLRARHRRREEYVGTWLPEPVVVEDDVRDPEHEALVADSVGLALLAVLEKLSPAERIAFVLHDMFAVPFDDIAEILDREPAAARQLASRARRRLRGEAPINDADLAAQRTVVDAFVGAVRSGDFEALVAILDPEVVFSIDVGMIAPGARPAVKGSQAVIREVRDRGPQFAHLGRPAIVNGAAGLVIETDRKVLGVVAFTIMHGLVTRIDIVADPEKLRSVRSRSQS
jgi:RNA polymerase sigma-70 factor (ECF subfamily)